MSRRTDFSVLRVKQLDQAMRGSRAGRAVETALGLAVFAAIGVLLAWRG